MGWKQLAKQEPGATHWPAAMTRCSSRRSTPATPTLPRESWRETSWCNCGSRRRSGSAVSVSDAHVPSYNHLTWLLPSAELQSLPLLLGSAVRLSSCTSWPSAPTNALGTSASGDCSLSISHSSAR